MAIYIAIKAQIIRFSDSRDGGSRIPETINKLDSQPRLQGKSPSNFPHLDLLHCGDNFPNSQDHLWRITQGDTALKARSFIPKLLERERKTQERCFA